MKNITEAIKITSNSPVIKRAQMQDFTASDFEYLLRALEVYEWGKHDFFINRYELRDLYKKVWEEACSVDSKYFDRGIFGHGDINRTGYND